MKPMIPFRSTMASVSLASSNKPEMAAAAMRMMTIGLRNWPRNRRHVGGGGVSWS
jgi:hypothetical protein